MNENLYRLFDNVFISDFSINDEGIKKIIDLGQYGKLETYSLFPGIILAFIDICVDNYDAVFAEEELPSRLLQINHCSKGRYAYMVGEDKMVYFGNGDLCISVYDSTRTMSEFPLGFYLKNARIPRLLKSRMNCNVRGTFVFIWFLWLFFLK